MPLSKNVAATAITSLVFLVGMLGQYLGGHIAERHDPAKSYLTFHAAALPMAFLMAFAVNVPLVIVTMLYLLFLLGMQPIENTLVAELTPDTLRHSAYGVKFILTFGVGALAVHFVAWVEQAWSISAVFAAMSGVSLGIVISIAVLILVIRNMHLSTPTIPKMATSTPGKAHGHS
jgi:MFS family permease